MLSVFSVDAHNTVVFAVQELRQYLRMMSEAGEISVSYATTAKSGIRVGLMSSFVLETSDIAEGELDKILYATVAEGNVLIH